MNFGIDAQEELLGRYHSEEAVREWWIGSFGSL